MMENNLQSARDFFVKECQVRFSPVEYHDIATVMVAYANLVRPQEVTETPFINRDEAKKVFEHRADRLEDKHAKTIQLMSFTGFWNAVNDMKWRVDNYVHSQLYPPPDSGK